jgi:serine/threonine-protein kinase
VSLAHENGLIHRDLKPENIFLEQSGHRQATKILDFGLAKPLAPEATGTVAPTLPGALIGTPAYMSPEQLRGDVPAERWDVWALAVVAFEMLTGVHPSVLVSDARSWVAGDRRATALLESPELSAPTRSFFERAFAPDCSKRPESARQLLDELDAALRPGTDTPLGAVTRHR